MFRTANKNLDIEKLSIIIELVAYISCDDTPDADILEISCGWTKLNLSSFRQPSNKLAPNKQTLKLFGGSVFKKGNIGEVKFNREGAKHLMAKALKAYGNSHLIESEIIVQIKPLTQLTKQNLLHTECLPNTCLV